MEDPQIPAPTENPQQEKSIPEMTQKLPHPQADAGLVAQSAFTPSSTRVRRDFLRHVSSSVYRALTFAPLSEI
jgi:hypothetical protein